MNLTGAAQNIEEGTVTFHVALDPLLLNETCLKTKIFAPVEWYSCRGLAVVANSGISTLGFKHPLSGVMT